MMATVPHITSGLGLGKFQADGFLLTRVYICFSPKSRQEGRLVEDVHIKLMFKLWSEELWEGFTWLKKGTSSRLLLARRGTSGVSELSEGLLALQDTLRFCLDPLKPFVYWLKYKRNSLQSL